jgi:hypothetical protein
MITKLQRFYRQHYQQRQIRDKKLECKRTRLFEKTFSNVSDMAKDSDSYLSKIHGLERHASLLSEYYLTKA